MKERLLVVADTHGAIEQVVRFAKNHGPFTSLVHLGDYTEDGEILAQRLELPLYAVAGNGDDRHLTQERIISVGKYEALLIHGHRVNLFDEENLWRLAKKRGVNILLFGHTHRPYYHCKDEVHVANPGSPTLPRGGYAPSMMILEVRGKELAFHHMTIMA